MHTMPHEGQGTTEAHGKLDRRDTRSRRTWLVNDWYAENPMETSIMRKVSVQTSVILSLVDEVVGHVDVEGVHFVHVLHTLEPLKRERDDKSSLTNTIRNTYTIMWMEKGKHHLTTIKEYLSLLQTLANNNITSSCKQQ